MKSVLYRLNHPGETEMNCWATIMTLAKNSQQKSLLAICTAQAVRGTRIPSILLCLMR